MAVALGAATIGLAAPREGGGLGREYPSVDVAVRFGSMTAGPTVRLEEGVSVSWSPKGQGLDGNSLKRLLTGYWVKLGIQLATKLGEKWGKIRNKLLKKKKKISCQS